MKTTSSTGQVNVQQQSKLKADGSGGSGSPLSSTPSGTGMTEVKTGKSLPGSSQRFDSVGIQSETNYSDFYINPDLESLLNTRGFSTQRPEMLGVFEWQPNLTTGFPMGPLLGKTGSQDKEYSLTPSGELFDYQCQLKALRYTDALGFFEKMIGYRKRRARGAGLHGYKLVGKNAKSKKYMNVYEENMKTAFDLLTYLSSIYESIDKFIELQQIKGLNLRLNRTFTTPRQSDNIGYYKKFKKNVIFPTRNNVIAEDLDALSTSLWTGRLDFHEIMEILGDYPTEWVNKSSNTAIILQLFTYFFGLMNFEQKDYFNQEGKDLYYSGDYNSEDDIVEPNGIFSYTTYEKPGASSANLQLGSTWIDIGKNLSVDASNSNGTPRLRQDGRTINESDNAFIMMLSSASSTTMAGLCLKGVYQDFIQGLFFESLDSDSKMRRADSGRTDIARYTRGTLGFSGRKSHASIADIAASAPSKTIARKLMPKDKDERDSNSFVETYTSSHFDVSSGDGSMKSGRSYYVDEISTREIGEAIDRLTDLREDLGWLGSLTSKELPGMLGTKISGLSGHLNQYYYGDDWFTGSTAIHIAIKSFKKKMSDGIFRDANQWSYNEYIPILAVALATQDSTWQHDLLALVLARDEARHGNRDSKTDDMYKTNCRNIGHYIQRNLMNHIRTALFTDVTYDKEWRSVTWGISGKVGQSPDDNTDMSSDYKNSPLDYISDRTYESSAGGGFDTSAALDEWEEWFTKNSYFAATEGAFGRDILSIPIEIVDDIDQLIILGKLEEYGDKSKSDLRDISARGLDRKSRITAAFWWCMAAWKKCIVAGFQVCSEVERHANSEGSYQYTYVRGRAFFNFRLIKSLDKALFSYQEGISYDSLVSEIEADSDYVNYVGSVWNHTTGKGSSDWIKTLYHTVAAQSLNGAIEDESRALATLSVLSTCIDRLSLGADLVSGTTSGNDFSNLEFADALAEIKSDPNFSKATILSLSRDQLQLGWALYDSFSETNRVYPYLPAAKAITPVQGRLLAGFSKGSKFTGTSTGGSKKFIMPVGIPAGMMESLRNRAIDATGDISYKDSDLIKVNLWRRNLRNESEITKPKSFVFDTSKFIITGRTSQTSGKGNGSQYLDAGIRSPQALGLIPDYEHVLLSTIIRRYHPWEKNTLTYRGKAFHHNFQSEEYDFTSGDVFLNHCYDHYLNTYLRLTMGIDVSEDVFPFLEGNVLFDGVDPGLEDLYETLSKDAGEMFADRDIESALNYDRLIGELRRSVIMSSQKYRNRIIYPKVFERVFCLFVDPEDWEPIDEDEDSAGILGQIAQAISQFWSREVTQSTESYYQFYTTVTILPPASYFLPEPGTGTGSGTSSGNTGIVQPSPNTVTPKGP